VIEILILYALFASTFTLGTEVVRFVPPVFFVGIRMVLGGFLLLGFVKFWKNEHFRFPKKEWPWFIGIIFFHIFLSYILEYFCYQYLTSSKVCLLYNLSPFVTALFSYFCFNEVMTPKKWIGLAIGFFSFLPLLYATAPAEELTLGSLGFISVPELIAFISVVSAAAGWIFMQKLTRHHQHSYIFVNGVGMLGGGLLALMTSWCLEVWPTYSSLASNFVFWRCLFLLILIGNVICFNLYGKLLHKYSATILSFFGFFTPLFSALFGWYWLGETVSIAFFLTAFLVTFGLYLFYQEELRQGYILE